MKVLTIVKDDGITGVEYGVVEVPEKSITTYNAYERKVAINITQATIRNRMKSIIEHPKHK